jgi:hypothetical protein
LAHIGNPSRDQLHVAPERNEQAAPVMDRTARLYDNPAGAGALKNEISSLRGHLRRISALPVSSTA